MNLSLDFDNTASRDLDFWYDFIASAQQKGYNVYLVTMRTPEEAAAINNTKLPQLVDGVFYTSRKAKKKFMFDRGICIDVWIDDTPFFVENDAIG